MRHRYRRAVVRTASHARVDSTVRGRLAAIATLDRLADVADAAGDAAAAAALDRCIGELYCAPRPTISACRSDIRSDELFTLARAALAPRKDEK